MAPTQISFNQSDVIGVDFGTTNTVLAGLGVDGKSKLLELRTGNSLRTSLRTTLGFRIDPDDVNQTVAEAGELAIDQFIDDPEGTRFLQSIKTYAASKLFRGTRIHHKFFLFEDLLQEFFDCFWRYSCSHEIGSINRMIIGRPVRFAGNTPDEQLALERYRKAFARQGVDELLFVYEPVAAAFHFARQLTQSATVLVADFGGGTTDYSIVRFDVGDNGISARPLGHGGIGIAGDQFDYRIIERLILPELGKGSRYSSMGRMLDIPSSLFTNFARWDRLSVFKNSQDYQELKKLVRVSDAPEKLELLIALVDSDQGYPLYKAVSEVKQALSCQPEAQLNYAEIGQNFAPWVKREDFEFWIDPDLNRMRTALDEMMNRCAVADEDIDNVFLTGGSSFVPAVRRIFEDRFGKCRVETGDQLVSIASGLALIGQRDDAIEWTFDGGASTFAAA